MGANVPVVPTLTALPTPTPKALIRSSTPTKGAAEPTTLDVPPQAKHPRGESSQMDVRSMIVAGGTVSGTEGEDPAEYFDSHEDAGKLLDPLVDNAETEEATKAKLKELERLAEFGVYEIVETHMALDKKRVTTRWDPGRMEDGIRARLVAREFMGDETMYDVFAPSSTPSTGRSIVVSHVHSRRDKRTFGNPTSVLWRLLRQVHGQRRAGTRWVDFMAALKSRVLTSVTQHHTSLQITSGGRKLSMNCLFAGRNIN